MPKGRHAVLAALIALSCTLFAAGATIFAAPPAWLEGLLFDSAVAAGAPARDDAAMGVAVVGVDARSLDAPEFADYPRAMFGKYWAQTIQVLKDAGAKVITFDFIFSYARAEKLEPGFDKPFMRALFGAREQIVIGRSPQLLPLRKFQAALKFDPTALGRIDYAPDADDVYRRLKTRFQVPDEEPQTSLSGAALMRAGVRQFPETVVLAPTRHPEDIPTYSLIDVYKCARSEPDALRKAFSGKIVFIGTILNVEDRKPSSARFLAPTAGSGGPRTNCGLHRLPASNPLSRTVPGVHLHAVAAQSVLSGRTVAPADPLVSTVLAGGAAFAGAAIAFTLSPVLAVIAILAAGLLLWGAEVWLLISDYWLATANALLFLVASAMVAYLVRFFVIERRSRRIHNAFGHYLAPTLVDRLAEGESTLKLGGEARDVTIMFADLSGFTALSEKVGPEQLVEMTNASLKVIADIVDDSGGYIDKFIGDAVMAMWNAPADDPDHACNAVSAALKIGEAIAAARSTAEARGEHGFDVKIGINSGSAVVGNVGSDKRYNYTAVGEAVNIAARLEGLPGIYNCRVIVGPETARRLEGVYHFREIDSVEVKGKSEPLNIYEPVEKELPYFARYAEALELYRGREFGTAAGLWAGLTNRDGPSVAMARRARAFAENPPPADWDGVFVMDGK